MNASNNSYLFSGMAQLPKETDLYLHKYLTIIMEVDIADGMIKECDVPVYSGMHKNFVSTIFVGKSLNAGYDYFLKEINKRIHSVTKKALIQAFQSLYNRYITVRKSMLSGGDETFTGNEDANEQE